jgi:hypothetical protein
MALTEEDVEQVGDYVKAHLDDWASGRVPKIDDRFDGMNRRGRDGGHSWLVTAAWR